MEVVLKPGSWAVGQLLGGIERVVRLEMAALAMVLLIWEEARWLQVEGVYFSGSSAFFFSPFVCCCWQG